MDPPVDLVGALRECPATRYPDLLRRAVAQPADDLARRALADAMRADGDDWAALIELQLAWEGLNGGDRNRIRRDSVARQAEIVRCYPQLYRAVAGTDARGPLEMARGLVEHAKTDAATVLGVAGELFGLTPLTSLDLGLTDEAQARALAHTPQLAALRGLRLTCPDVGDAAAIALVTSPILADLEVLALYDAGISDATVRVLAETTNLRTLRDLTICNTRLTRQSIEALVHAPIASTLRALSLEGGFTDVTALASSSAILRLDTLWLLSIRAGDAIGTLVGAPVVAGLKELNIDDRDPDPDAVIWLIDSLEHLETIWLSGCHAGDAVVAALPDTRLQSVSLRGAALGPAGARTLARNNSPGLWRLDLSLNAIGDDGAAALASGAFAPALTRLGLLENGIGPRGAAALVRAMPDLVELDLGGNPIGDAGAELLASTPNRLEMLGLSSCGITAAGARALLDSPHLAQTTIVLSRDVGPEIKAELRARRDSRERLLALGGSLRLDQSQPTEVVLI